MTPKCGRHFGVESELSYFGKAAAGRNDGRPGALQVTAGQDRTLVEQNYVPGPMFEENLRRALPMAEGGFAVFVTRPISRT